MSQLALISHKRARSTIELRKRHYKPFDYAKTTVRMIWQKVNRANSGKKIKKSYKKENVEAKNLNVQDLHDHFKTCSANFRQKQRDTQPGVNQNGVCEELDAEFTYEELRSAIFSQKDNKSPGIDNIPSKIIKAPYEFISPFLIKIYNRIDNTGENPRSCGDGIITTLFKKAIQTMRKTIVV